MENFQKIAVLIDADNTQLSKLEAVLHEVSAYGRIVVKKAYGNWRKDSLKNWEPELKRLAIRAEQQFDYVAGKNTTDIAMVIGAMDLLHNNMYDALVLVSPGRIICEIGMMEYPSAMSASMIPASASGVCSAALWNSTMLPGCTRVSTREVISSLLRPFQSRESTSH